MTHPCHAGTGHVCWSPRSKVQGPKSSDRSARRWGGGGTPGRDTLFHREKPGGIGLSPPRDGRLAWVPSVMGGKRGEWDSFFEEESKVQSPRSVVRRSERRLTLDFGPGTLDRPRRDGTRCFTEKRAGHWNASRQQFVRCAVYLTLGAGRLSGTADLGARRVAEIGTTCRLNRQFTLGGRHFGEFRFPRDDDRG